MAPHQAEAPRMAPRGARADGVSRRLVEMTQMNLQIYELGNEDKLSAAVLSWLMVAGSTSASTW